MSVLVSLFATLLPFALIAGLFVLALGAKRTWRQSGTPRDKWTVLAVLSVCVIGSITLLWLVASTLSN